MPVSLFFNLLLLLEITKIFIFFSFVIVQLLFKKTVEFKDCTEDCSNIEIMCRNFIYQIQISLLVVILCMELFLHSNKNLCCNLAFFLCYLCYYFIL